MMFSTQLIASLGLLVSSLIVVAQGVSSEVDIVTFKHEYRHSAAFARSESSLLETFQVPPSLRQSDKGYDHRPALFGIPSYPGSLAANVYYANSTLCNPIVDKTKGYPRRAYNIPWPAPFILMVDRGDCSFALKVRNAQHAGAAAVLIADTTCLCSDVECISDQPCQPTEPIMAGDGSASDISIPSFLLFKMDAGKIKSEVKENRPVVARMSWSMKTPDDRVEYDIWSSAFDPASKEFYCTFKKMAMALRVRAYFTPHMSIYDGISAGCQGVNGEEQCMDACTNNGRYCAFPSDSAKVSGSAVVTESLRRLCVWAHYGIVDGIGEKWWDYIVEFTSRCDVADYYSDPNCIKDAYKHAGIDGNKIERCMKDSGGTERDGCNSKLDMEIASQSANGVVVYPKAVVDKVPMQDELSPKNVFKAICRAYHYATLPSICSTCADCPTLEACIDDGVCLPFGSDTGEKEKRPMNPSATPLQQDSAWLDSTTLLVFIMALLLLLVTAITALYVQRRMGEKEKIIL